MREQVAVLTPEQRLNMMRTWLTVHRHAAGLQNVTEAAHAAAGVAEHATALIVWASRGGCLPPGRVVMKGEHQLIRDGDTVRVYRNGQLLGHCWDDPKSDGYAVFRHGNPTPIARPTTERGCILKLTDGEWDGQP